MPPRISAPFSDDQVVMLNDRQDAGLPPLYLCPSHPVTGFLVAATGGLSCPRPDCGYSQDWAWAIGAIPGWVMR